MNIQLSSATQSHPSKNGVLRLFRHFSPSGFDENVWILFEGDEVGQELFDELCDVSFRHVFEHEQNLPAVERFENAMREINEKLEKEAVLPENFLHKNAFVIALAFENQLHFTIAGEAEVYLVRNDAVMLVSDHLSGTTVSDDIFLNIASGEIQDGDIVFLSTIKILQSITKKQLRDIVENTPKEALETLFEFLPQSEGGVFSCVAVDGNPVLPFHTEEISSSASLKKGISIPSFPLMGDVFSHPKIANVVSLVQKKMPKQKKKREMIIVASLLIVGFLGWNIISALSTGVSGETEKYRTELSAIENMLGSVKNMNEEGRKEDALKMLEEVKTRSQVVFNESTFREQASKFSQEAQTLIDEISGTQRISTPSLVALPVEEKSDSLQGILLFDKNIYAYGAKTLFRILGGELENTIDLKAEEKVIKGIAFPIRDRRVFLTETGKIIEHTAANTVAFVKTEDENSWKKGVDIGVFDKYLYVLVPSENQIYKYLQQGNEYAKPTQYISSEVDLSGAISMTIEGEIFVLNADGSVIRLFRGKKMPFELKNIPVEFKNVTHIFTTPDSDMLAFLSAADKRVFIFLKDNDEMATFDRQVVIGNESVGVLTGIAVDGSANRILVSDDKKIYAIPL